jgi:hypothetical protein
MTLHSHPGGDIEKTLVTAALSIFVQLGTPEVSRCCTMLHDRDVRSRRPIRARAYSK